MDASLMKASALRLRFSQSLASRRQRLSQAMVRSTRELPLRVMFQDEARFGRINDPKRCWSPKRTRPTVGKQIIREYTYAYGAVSPRDGAADFLILPVMTAVAMKVFLDELARRHDGQYILMIYDGAPCHSPGALNIPDTMTVRTLPPYSPQLNPVENIWDDMREKFFANIVFESMDAVENKISEACLHYEENTETVRSITAFPWIADNL